MIFISIYCFRTKCSFSLLEFSKVFFYLRDFKIGRNFSSIYFVFEGWIDSRYRNTRKEVENAFDNFVFVYPYWKTF